MKKIVGLLMLLICVMGTTACNNTNDDVLHLGVNAVITELDTEKQQITHIVSIRNENENLVKLGE